MEYDVAVIGTGPAGLQAAIHAARKKVSVVVLGKVVNSAMTGTHVENYFGIPGAKDGDSILADGIAQAKAFGCTFVEYNVISAEDVGGSFVITAEDDSTYEVKSVVIATGVSRKALGVPGEKELFGKGVSYCAICDCNFYRGRVVAIVGDETEAAVSAAMMTRYASKTYWVSADVKASSVAKEKAIAAGAILLETSIESIRGENRVSSMVLADGSEVDVDGVFIELGAKSSADLAMDLGVMPEMDDSIKVDRQCGTEVPGVYACGDVTGKPWQVAKAVGEGCIAGLSAADHAKGRMS
ncbi:MAG: FAD-binding protein [Thermoplasmata archaeon]|nr:FAD-binding protein [Thermoplasmata archaeon]